MERIRVQKKAMAAKSASPFTNPRRFNGTAHILPLELQ